MHMYGGGEGPKASEGDNDTGKGESGEYEGGKPNLGEGENRTENSEVEAYCRVCTEV